MKLWRTDRAEPMRVFQGHKHLILQVGVARKCLVKPSGRFRMDMTVFEDQELHQAETESADDVVDAEAVRYPCVLISISYDRNVVVWDATNAQQITGMHVCFSHQIWCKVLIMLIVATDMLLGTYVRSLWLYLLTPYSVLGDRSACVCKMGLCLWRKGQPCIVGNWLQESARCVLSFSVVIEMRGIHPYQQNTRC